MRKGLILALIMAVALVMMTACGGSSSESEQAAEPSGDATVIKIGHVTPEDHALHQAFLKFKDAVEEESGGELTVEIYPNGELGSERQLLEAVNLGTIQITNVSISNFEQYDKKFGIMSLPFLHDSQENMENAITGEFGQMFLDWMEEYGFYGLGYDYSGARSISSNVQPIESIEDMKGLKIRVMESDTFVEMFKLMGANPTPMSFTEVYTALQQGTVDAQDNPPMDTYTSKFYEVQKYYSLTKHVYSNCANVANLDFINSLSDENREIVIKNAKKWLQDWVRAQETEQEAEYVTQINDAGCVVNELSPENLKAFKDAVAPMYDKMREEVGDEVMDKALELAN